jgi:hypothetical protein
MKYNRKWIWIIAVCLLLTAMLACTGAAQNLRIEGQPQYICPSSTPCPTHTPLPTDLPLWPPYFTANISGTQVGPNTNTIYAQWTGQKAGTVYLSYSGSLSTSPYVWTGSNGFFVVDTIPGPTSSRAYGITLPLEVISATISLYADGIPGSAQTFTVMRVYTPLYPTLIPFPGGAPGSLTATPRPTYTPWPTPTQYIRTNDYFIGDAIYTPLQPSGLRLRFRVTDIDDVPAEPNEEGQPQSIYAWTIEVKNVGSLEYDVFPAAQMYISTITLPTGIETDGVWGASQAAAEEAGLPADIMVTDIQPGQTKTFTLAAYGPRGTARRLVYVLDPTEREPGNPTQVPGRNLVTWIHEVNTICSGDIAED